MRASYEGNLIGRLDGVAYITFENKVCLLFVIHISTYSTNVAVFVVRECSMGGADHIQVYAIISDFTTL